MLAVLGAVCVVAGGLVAAVTGPLDLLHGSWAAAYLVLVCGVASLVVAAAQTWLVAGPVPSSAAAAQALAWVAGNVGVLGGTLAGSSPLVVVGGVLLVVALVVALAVALRVRHRLLGWAYRLVLVLVTLSIPVGLVLSVVRHR